MIIKINNIIAEHNEVYQITKQVNDIGNIANRQSNITNIKLPYTSTNEKIFNFLSATGNTSSFPYQKQSIEIIDQETGEHIIRNGIAIIKDVGDGYRLAVYDGIIEFIKLIENKTLYELGLTELNHIKNVTNIITTWTADLNYKYLLADYNGKNTHGGLVNLDFQVPSVKVSYLWNKIFSIFGYTYSGLIFEKEDFLRLWMSYPKAPPTNIPDLILIDEGEAEVVVSTVPYWEGFALITATTSYVKFFTGEFNRIEVNTTGVYRINLTGYASTSGNYSYPPSTSTKIKIDILDTTNQVINSQTLDTSLLNYADMYVLAGQKIRLFVQDLGITFFTFDPIYLTTNIIYNVSLINGYFLGFDDAFIDLKCTDFLREIMVRFGLTPYVDKNRKHIDFLTLYERLQNEVIDWSEKYVDRKLTKFVYSNYAKENQFKFRYNSDNEKHNDSSLKIANENINESYVVFQSQTYSPEKLINDFLGGSNTYKIWERELKDNGDFDYKPLEGRFYFLKDENINASLHVKSELLSQNQTTEKYSKANYFNCKWNDLLLLYYSEMQKILTDAKIHDVELNLNSIDFLRFDFKSLIFIKQLGGYFFVNKLIQGRNNDVAKAELVEVKYFVAEEIIDVIEYINIVSVGQTNCEVNVIIDTNKIYSFDIIIEFYEYYFNVFGGWENQLRYTRTQNITSSTFNVDRTGIPNGDYKIKIKAGTFGNQIESGLSESIALTGSCFGNFPSAITITNVDVTNLGQVTIPYYPNVAIKKSFDIDISIIGTFPFNAKIQFLSGGFVGQTNDIIITSNNVIVENIFALIMPDAIRIVSNTTTSNTYNL